VQNKDILKYLVEHGEEDILKLYFEPSAKNDVFKTSEMKVKNMVKLD